MTLSGFLKAGHLPTLIAAFLYFDVSFLVWVILGPLGPFLGDALRLNASEKGFLVAVPLLAGSIFRPLLGMLADRVGGRRTALTAMALTALPLLLGWRFASALPHFILIGILLGVAGASFAVALPLASRWYPPQYQGLTMGIAGAGNSGTVLATLFIPRLATAYGWQNAFAIALIPLLAVMVAFALMAKEAPSARRKAGSAGVASLLKQGDTGWFCLFYSVTFGGFVGLASFLTLFFTDHYGLPKVAAGDMATLAVIAGSGLRPLGGWVADRVGGYRLLLVVFAGVACCMGAVSLLPPLAWGVALLVVIMGLLGMGNGAVFQLVPQRFPSSVGIVTGLVGAAGGLGGFFLPSLLGLARQITGSYGAGLAALSFIGASAFVILLGLGPAWLRRWEADAGRRCGIFSYRSWFAGEEEAA